MGANSWQWLGIILRCIKKNVINTLLIAKVMNKTKKISFGDKIFARVTRNGRTVFNFVSEQVANMADLISQLRRAMKDIHGLVMIHIRNYNQGWGDERPLMLYAEKIKNSPVTQEIGVRMNKIKDRQMFFPWEIH